MYVYFTSFYAKQFELLLCMKRKLSYVSQKSGRVRLLIFDRVLLLQLKRREESEAALESLRSDLERQHQEDVSRLKAQWKTDTQAETELRVREQLETARKSWQEEQETVSDDH